MDIVGFGGMGFVVGGMGALTACVERDKYKLFSKYSDATTTNMIINKLSMLYHVLVINTVLKNCTIYM